VHMISEKAIRFRHPDYNPDRTQKLISTSHKVVPSLSLSDRQMHLPPPLSEVGLNKGQGHIKLKHEMCYNFQRKGHTKFKLGRGMEHSGLM